MNNCILWSGSMKNGRPYKEVKGKGVNIRRVEYVKVFGELLLDDRVTMSCTTITCINPQHMIIVKRNQLLNTPIQMLNHEQILEIFISDLPQATLAERLNVSQSTISRYRNYRVIPQSH